MIEHAVPQNVTSYQFRLIGNMTIKQFILLLLGAGVGFLFYSTNLPGIIKWPFAIVSVLVGVAMAFLPFEERTMDQWIVNFIKAIYRPTKFYWRRTAHPPEYFSYSSTSKATAPVATPQTTLQRRQQMSAYISSLRTAPTAAHVQDQLDIMDRDTNQYDQLFTTVEAAKNVTPSAAGEAPKPHLGVRARPLLGYTVYEAATPTPVIPQMTVEEMESAAPAEAPAPAPANAQVVPLESIVASSNQPGAATTREKSPAAITPTGPATPTGAYAAAADTAQIASTRPEQPVFFSKDLPFPSLPDKPNILVGMVHDTQGGILPGAIIEILDDNGSTVRAMKTNTLGQFYISTPLKPGHYRIETEHNTHQFPIYTVDLNDTVLDPVDIRALS